VHIHDIELESLAINVFLSILSISVVWTTRMPAIIIGRNNPLNMEELLRNVLQNVLF
jgi:hypothetical protein